jgi:hypothetical protein
MRYGDSRLGAGGRVYYLITYRSRPGVEVGEASGQLFSRGINPSFADKLDVDLRMASARSFS